MEVTLDKLLSGKSTRINSKDFLSTEDYVKPFIEGENNREILVIVHG